MSRNYTCVGFTPYSHQRAVINQLKDGKPKIRAFTSKVTVVKSSRQKGKTFMIANLLLSYAIDQHDSKVFCVSPTLKQSKSIYKTIIDAISDTPILRTANATDLEVRLLNRSYIYFRSAEQGTVALRGYTADFLCIDECAFISDEVFYTILPWCDAHRAQMLLVSTPYVKEGFFWKYYNMGLDENVKNVTTIDWCDERFREDIEKILPPEKLEEYRRFLPASQFKSEYLGEWLDDDGCVFTNFMNCIRKTELSDGDRLYVGIDWANGGNNDDTALSILNQDGRQVALYYWNDLNTSQQIDKIANILLPLKNQIVSIQTELNSIGTPYTDLLKERLQRTNLYSKVEGFNTTNQSKSDLVTKLQVAFENEMISILPDDKQKRELSAYAAEYNPKTKNVSYNAPQGLHDDLCIALMLSYNALKEETKRGNYSIGGSRMTYKMPKIERR